MPASLQGVPIGSLVHRFITSGKPGNCELCNAAVNKLEAHHIKYSPEITINLCHACHHRSHFWPQRLSSPEKLKILKKVFPEEIAQSLSVTKFADVSELAKIVAPSRQAFIHAAQQLEQKSQILAEKNSIAQPNKKNKTPSHVKAAILSLPRLKDASEISRRNFSPLKENSSVIRGKKVI